MYVSGWLKRGPTGVIATTMHDAYETADTILQDIQANRLSPSNNDNDLTRLLNHKKISYIDLNGWLKIEAKEQFLGQQKGKECEKLASLEDLIKVAK